MNTKLSGWLCVLLAMTCSPAVFAESLVIGAGKEVRITPEQQVLTLDQFIMEDGASISFAPGVTHFHLSAREAAFGNNTRINGRGYQGQSGANGKTNSPTTGCSGIHPDSLAAQNGQIGQAGVDIQMRLGITSFKSLNIDVSGGTGGDGGQGANVTGQTGCKNLAGGRGGNAGNGGDSGHVLIAYWSADKNGYIPISNYGTGIQITIDAGKPGKPGKGGEGAEGGQTRDKKKGARSASFGKIEATPGASGAHGKQGQPGKSGTFLVRPVTDAVMAEAVSAQTHP